MTEMRDNLGLVIPIGDAAALSSARTQLRPRPSLFRRYRMFLLSVILPTLLAAAYFYLIAADQYVSEARFVVRSNQGQATSSLLEQVLHTSGLTAAQNEQFSLDDFLLSHDAVNALQSQMDLVVMYRRPKIDLIARLWYEEPSREDLLKYYRRQVSAFYDSSTGITTLRAYAFGAEDSHQVAEALLSLGEKRVNQFTKRAEADTLRVATDEVARAEDRFSNVQKQITAFRIKEQAVDPQKSATTVLEVIGNLENQLAETRAQLAGTTSYLAEKSPQYLALTDRIRALEAQINAQRLRLTGADGSLAPILAQYEQLMLERQFADRGYASALASLEVARLEAIKQHLYVVRVVEPNMPEEALYPKSTLIVASVFVGLLVAYGIGWLIIAGVKEHTA